MSTYQRTGKRIFFFTVFFMAVLLFAGKGNVQAKRKSVALNKTTVTAYKGMVPVKLKVKNVKKGKNIIWFSSKSSVAEVSQDGTVTFHKKGNAIVQAKVGKKTLKCIVSVCSKKAYKAVEKAKKFHSARNMSYSQETEWVSVLRIVVHFVADVIYHRELQWEEVPPGVIQQQAWHSGLLRRAK